MTEPSSRPLGRLAILALGVLSVALIAGLLALGGSGSRGSPAPGSGGPGSGAAPGGSSSGPANPVPTPGFEVYGFVPYWEMDGTIAAHLAGTRLTTLALFSVTNKRNGSLDTTQRGYKAITGPLGEQLIREAHDRGVRVEIVFTSFGATKNKQLFGAAIAIQDRVIAGFVELVDRVGADGVNVDVEGLGPSLVPAYGAFVGRLRSALRAGHPAAQVSVATQANENGAALAAAADANGVDRIFLMGYDYHYAGSQPGASAPIDRRDGAVKDLVWSLDLYQALGVPVQKTLLGLPLYGMAWPVAGPQVGAPSTGKGEVWIPSDHLDVLHDPALVPVLDEIEQVEVYTLPVGPAAASAGGASAAGSTTEPSGPAGSGSGPAASAGAWQAIYVEFAGHSHPEDEPRERSWTGRRGLLGDRLRARCPGVHGAHRAVRVGSAEVGGPGRGLTVGRPPTDPVPRRRSAAQPGRPADPRRPPGCRAGRSSRRPPPGR